MKAPQPLNLTQNFNKSPKIADQNIPTKRAKKARRDSEINRKNPSNKVYRHKNFYGDDSIVEDLKNDFDYSGISHKEQTPWNSNDPKNDDFTQFQGF